MSNSFDSDDSLTASDVAFAEIVGTVVAVTFVAFAVVALVLVPDALTDLWVEYAVAFPNRENFLLDYVSVRIGIRSTGTTCGSVALDWIG